MKTIIALLFLLICAGCDSEKKPAPVSSPTSQPSPAPNAYRVLSYDATWTNESGNEGQFVLEHNGLKITAFCGGRDCSTWIDAVGKSMQVDGTGTGLIMYKDPRC